MKIDVKKEVVGRLSLAPIKDATGYKFGGLIPAKLISVEVVKTKHEKGEFKDSEVPELRFSFTNYKTSTIEPDKFYTYVAKIVSSKKYAEDKETMLDREEEDTTIDGNKVIGINSNIAQEWAVIKSILEGCSEMKNYKDISKISAEEVDKYFDLPARGAAAMRMTKWGNFFEFIAQFVNDKDAPMIPTTGVPMWLKLLPDYQNERYYQFPTYVGKGIIEPMRFGANKEIQMPVKLQLYPNESLTLKSKGSKQPSGAPAVATATDNDVEALLAQGRE